MSRPYPSAYGPDGSRTRAATVRRRRDIPAPRSEKTGRRPPDANYAVQGRTEPGSVAAVRDRPREIPARRSRPRPRKTAREPIRFLEIVPRFDSPFVNLSGLG